MKPKLGARSKQCKMGIPKGRSNYVIYAVVLREHPHIVKLGRSSNWRNRRQSYDNWNLAPGDGVLDCAVYYITEEWVDMRNLEHACLSAMNIRPYRGNEWFKASLDQAKLAIEDTLHTAELSYLDM